MCESGKQRETRLEPRSIAELKNLRFRIPSYQRGYRWERLQVEQLLEDIAESDVAYPYYLQPVVVAPAPSMESFDGKPSEYETYDYDIIDGQQRLTTLYLILKALEKLKEPLSDEIIKQYVDSGRSQEIIKHGTMSHTLGGFDVVADYFILYETRKDSRIFLENISNIEPDDIRILSSPDHLYMWRAFQTICRWFNRQQTDIVKIQKVASAIKKQLRIIWYELPESIIDWKKFTDLNIGKIPLTNSELLKALFLRSSNFSNDKESEEYEKQTFVAQWDQIERELSDVDFWGFITTEDPSKYPTKIDLFLDLITCKSNIQSKDPYYTFNYFVEWFKKNQDITGLQKWNQIFLQYHRLRDWFNDREIYHRIGYLVSINFPTNILAKIIKFANPEGRAARSTDRIKRLLDRFVSLSIRIKPVGKFQDVLTFRDLKYNCADDPDNRFDNAHHYMIKRYLTLYNILMTENANPKLRYSFSYHNTIRGGWSIEHIHAQKSESLNKGWQWEQWVSSHLESLNSMIRNHKSNQALTEKMEILRDKMLNFKASDSRKSFDEIAESFREIMEDLPETKGLYQDVIANLALLGKYENSILNNSTFDVKRKKIISMLSTNFVPIATERVFMKAISGKENTKDAYSCDTEHLFFWGETDRSAYMTDMEEKLKKFL